MNTTKKYFTALASSVMIATSIALVASASTPVSIIMDGVTAPYTDTLPFVNDGSTMVPIRFVSEKLGAKVNWDNSTKTVGILKDGKSITLKVGSSSASVNGTLQDVGAKSMQKNSTVLVPLRFVSEVLGANVNWNAAESTVRISTGKEVGAVDDQGRAIRTTNLPSNASAYPYILKDIPNAMYEMAGRNIPRSTTTTAKQLYATDKLFQNGIYPKRWANNADEYYKLIFNVDYRTISNDWVDQVYSHMNTSNVMLKTDLSNYVAWVKKNHIILEGDLSAEPSMITYNSFDGYSIRGHYTVKFVNYDSMKDLIYDPLFSDGNQATKFKKGHRYEGYTDITISTNAFNGTLLKIDALTSLFLNSPAWEVK